MKPIVFKYGIRVIAVLVLVPGPGFSIVGGR